MTPSSPRVAGKLGARPAAFPAGLGDLTHYVAGALPKAPASVAVPAFPDWGMLSNDTLGCCGVAGIQHLMEAAATDASEQEQWPTAQQVADFYLTYTGGQDSGVVLSDFLAYVRKTGFYGHTVTAYAPVKVDDVSTLMTALYLYDAVYTGISVTQGMMDAFQAGKPWDAAAVQGEPVGGHCVPAVGYSDAGLTVITWGQPQLITWPAWHAVSTEAWAVITGELAGGDGHGVSLSALQADLDKLDVPAPAPAPQPGHPGLLAELAALVRRDAAAALAFLDRHGL